MAAAQPRGLALGALALAIAALVAALPVLWWRLTAGAGLSSGGVLAELAQVFGQGGTPVGPGWLVILRATAMLAGFLALVLGLVALILKQPGRLVAVAWVLALAALAAARPRKLAMARHAARPDPAGVGPRGIPLGLASVASLVTSCQSRRYQGPRNLLRPFL